MALIKFAISNPSESKKFISTIWLERIFLSLTGVLIGDNLEGGGVLGGGDLEGEGDGALLASLPLLLLLSSPLLLSSLLLAFWRWGRCIFGAIGREGDERRFLA